MQPGGHAEDMQTPIAPSAWCGNFHRAQELATQAVRCVFGCLPCVKGHHRVHPTILELSDALYIVIDGKKRLRVLHVVPDFDTSTAAAKANVADQTDSGDRCSLDSSGEDYWFMRWNRPIRPNLQRNLCNCSFRRSQFKSPIDLKNSKLVEDKSDNPVLTNEVNGPAKCHPNGNLSGKGGLDHLAEKLSHDIIIEAVQKSSEIKSKAFGLSQKSANISRTSEESSLKSCDTIPVDNVNEKQETELGGYVNPLFIASNDALDLIPSNTTQNHSCEMQVLEESNLNTTTKKHGSSMNEFQDYNANDQNHHSVQERNARNKQSASPLGDDCADKKRHRKSCLVGSKSYLKKPLLLLVHGAGSTCEVWRNLMSHLVGGGYECVAPDLLGHGLSSAPDKASYYTFRSFLQDLLCVFDRYVVYGRTAVILGHGYGCSLAAAIARFRSEQVTQLVLISGGGPTPLAPRNPPSVSLFLRACLEPLLMCGFKRDVVYSVCGKQMEPCTPETSGVPRHIVNYISQGHVWPEGDAAFHRRIAAPTLLVHGMRDQHITLVQECEMERTIPRSFLEVIPEAGHWAMLETPTHLSHMILCFIDWWAPPSRTQ